jgi:hypothetical protein
MLLGVLAEFRQGLKVFVAVLKVFKIFESGNYLNE